MPETAGNRGPHEVSCTFGHLMISADKAIPLGLLINEVVTNSAKHAYPDGSGEIRVSGERRDAELHVEVSDLGIGLAEGFRYRPTSGEPGLQGDQEPDGSTRRTHRCNVQHAKRRNNPTGRTLGRRRGLIRRGVPELFKYSLRSRELPLDRAVVPMIPERSGIGDKPQSAASHEQLSHVPGHIRPFGSGGYCLTRVCASGGGGRDLRAGEVGPA